MTRFVTAHTIGGVGSSLLATRPATIEALKSLVAQLPDVARMASTATDTAHTKRVGLFGLLGAMRDPAIQRAIGAAVAAARQAGLKTGSTP